MGRDRKGIRKTSYKQGINRLIQLSQDKGFLSLYKELNGKKANLSYKEIASYKRRISHLLENKDLPTNWTDYIYKYYTTDELSYPFREGIELMFGDQYMDDNILVIKKGKRLITPRDIKIIITKKVTKSALKTFIDDIFPLINEVQEQMGLPEIKSLNQVALFSAIDLIERKDKSDKSFAVIADEYYKELSGHDDTMANYLGDENNLKTIYYRYKPLLSP